MSEQKYLWELISFYSSCEKSLVCKIAVVVHSILNFSILFINKWVPRNKQNALSFENVWNTILQQLWVDKMRVRGRNLQLETYLQIIIYYTFDKNNFVTARDVNWMFLTISIQVVIICSGVTKYTGIWPQIKIYLSGVCIWLKPLKSKP